MQRRLPCCGSSSSRGTPAVRWCPMCLMRSIYIAALLQFAVMAQSPTWPDLMQSGKQAYLQGKYVDAEKQFQSALAEAEKTPEDQDRYIRTLQQLASVYRT